MTSIFNTIEVNTGRTARIINFLNSSPEFFIAIGKPTPWDSSYGINIDDNNPPFPNENQKEIIEPIIYKRLEIGVGANSIVAASSNSSQCSDFDNNQQVLSSISLIQQTSSQQNLVFYTLEQLTNNQGELLNQPEFIYVQGTILDTDYVEPSWRTSALYTKLFFNTGVSNSLNSYNASQVSGGLLHYLTYNTPVLNQPGKNHKFEYIINV